MDTVWIDINLGTAEYSEEEGEEYSKIYKAEIIERIELTKLSKLVSTGIDEDFKELLFQFGQALKRIKKIMEIKERDKDGIKTILQ